MRTATFLGLLAVSIALGIAGRAHSAAAHDAVTRDAHYAARGVVKSFGPKRAFVNIAHEKIPDYMDAMTMAFEARTEQQLAGIDVGQRVSFTFTATSDGRRILDGIAPL